MSVSMLHL